MKLPGLNYKSGVQSLGRQDIYAPMREAQAISSAIGISMNAIKGAVDAYEERKAQIETEEASLSAQQTSTSIRNRLDSTPFFKTEEVPDGIEICRTQTVVDEAGNKEEHNRENIPNYEVAPDIYRNQMESHLEALAENISNPNVKRSWLNGQRDTLNKTYGALKAQSLEKQQKDIQERQLNNVRQAIDSEQFLLASQLNKSSLLPDELKQELTYEIARSRETSVYNNAIKDEDLEMLVASEQYLSSDNYREQEGTLPPDTARTYAELIRRKIGDVTTRNDSAEKMRMKLLRDDGTTLREVLWEGTQNISPESVMQTLDKLQQYPVEFPILIQDIQTGIKFNSEFGALANLPPVQQERRLASMGKQVQGYREKQYYNRLVSARNKAMLLFDSDPITYGLTYGGINPDEWPALDFQNLSEGLNQRELMAESFYIRMGVDGGLLSDDDKVLFNNVLRTATADNKLNILGEVYEGLGSGSHKLYKELELTGEAPTFVRAGMAYADKDKATASAILRGADLLKQPEVKKLLSTKIDVISSVMTNERGNAYDRFPQQYNAVLVATKAIVAQRAMDNNEEIKEPMVEEAFEQATGGLIEFNGETFEAPVRNMNDSTFEKWFKSLHPSVISQMGNPYDHTGKQLYDRVKNSSYRLRTTGIRGTWFVVGPKGIIKERLRADINVESKEPFIFSYNPEYSELSTAARAKERVQQYGEKGVSPVEEAAGFTEPHQRLWENLPMK